MTKLRFAIVALLLTVLASQPACNRYGWAAAGRILDAVVTVAAIATVLAIHDTHFHSAYCGHRHVYYDGHPVYEYQGRWEYYDDYTDRWYVYEDFDYGDRYYDGY